jgi:hypothetical protein
MDIEKLNTAYRGLMNAVSDANVAAIGGFQEALRQQLDSMAKSTGLKGALKIDPKWAAEIVKQKNLELVRKTQELMVSRIKVLASRITGSESFQNPLVKQEIDEMSRTDEKKMKEIIAAMGIKVAAKKADGMLVELLEKMTGFSSVQIDRATVARHIELLRALHAKSINSLPTAEIKEEVKQLKALPIAELALVAEQFGLEKPGKAKPAIVKRIETKLKATYNAKVANQV